MEGDDEELSHLAGQLRAWRRRIEVTAEAPFRLLFRLEEPDVPEENEEIENDPDPWTLRYRLQSSDDPSLQIDVAEAWVTELSTDELKDLFRLRENEA